MAWGKGGSLRSCDALLKRIEDNDPKLTELVILPMKTFGRVDVERLSRAIGGGSNTNLLSISASGHQLSPESLKQFGSALSAQARGPLVKNGAASSGIASLAIGSKDMGDDGAVALCEGLEGSDGGLLRFVDMSWKKMGIKGLQAIGKTFAPSKFLTILDVSRNTDVGNEGIVRFVDAAKRSAVKDVVAFPSLRKLVLSECNIGPSGLSSLAEMIMGPSNSRSEPIDLRINSNPIGSDGCFALSRMCANSAEGSIISHLHAKKCAIGDDGIKLLADAAAVHPCVGLAVLDLSDNSITTVGAKAFAASLPKSWPDLTELNLAHNDLCDEGVVMLSDRIAGKSKSDKELPKKKSAIRNLDLSCTNCGIEGSKAAITSTSLKTLRLFNNNLGTEGFESISSLLGEASFCIENLDLGGNNASEEAVVALLNAIARIRDSGSTLELSVLEIGGNKFGEKAMEALRNLNQSWPQLDVAHDKPVQDATE